MTKWTTMQDKALSSRGNLLISASAGSGKTTVMVQKIADYLFASESADIGKLVVITFTKAIAEEMKQKLSDKLYEKLRAATDERERERIRKQINGIPVSNISTIDSFCAEIFKRYFEVIEKDPLVSVIDQGEADAMFAEAREEVLEQYLESHDKEFFELVDKFTARREIDRLRKAIDDIHKFLAVQSDADAFIFRALTMLGGKVEECETSHYILKHYRRKAARLAGLCETEYTTLNCFSTDQKIFSAFSDMLCICRDMLLNITHAKDIANLFAIAALSEKQKTNHLRIRSNMEDAEKSALEHAKTVISAANEFIEETHNRFGGCFKDALNAEKESRKAVTKLFDIACKVDDAYRKAKDREKRADFADIEHYALQILNNESVAEEMRNGIDSIFIDEYQDTNYLQESIIARISRGNVFMVGDVKQSIYKFRFAEPAIFLDKKDRYEATKEGLNLHFNENFRSSEEVLRFINMVFDEVMVYDLGGIDYRKDARLIYGPDKKVKKQNDFPDAEVAFFENEREDTEAYPAYYSVTNGPRYSEKPSSEALYIADRIQAMVGKAYIYDAKSDNYRLCRYSDMAILFRARSSGADIIAELRRRNIPFEAEGFREKGNTSPTELLICFAKLLDNDRQDFPLTAVMLSYFGKLNDKELLEIRSVTPKGYFWESVKAYKGNKSIENKIQKLFGLLRKYRRLSAFLSMRELLDRLISETGYDGYLLSLGDNQIRRVNAFVFSLTEKENASTLKAFLHFCGCAEEESVTASVADDCVTLTTVHKSKGLEYPVVFLPCAEYSPKGAQNSGDIILEDNSGTTIKKRKKMMDSGMIALDVKLGIAIMHINDEGRKTDTLSTVALKLKQENDRKSEQIRLLYVAMTRARQHLFISGKPSSKTCLFPD
ncbi:MAG: UvrD-helicase domain-containing protein, partial [Clostridia bacterium]|nr:UvrD-helicase domain-containing protein [Clostridia bacterium]